MQHPLWRRVLLAVLAYLVVDWLRYRSFKKRLLHLQIRRLEGGSSVDVGLLRFIHKIMSPGEARNRFNMEKVMKYGRISRESVIGFVIAMTGGPYSKMNDDEREMLAETSKNLCEEWGVDSTPVSPREFHALKPLFQFGASAIQPKFKPLPVWALYRLGSSIMANLLKFFNYRRVWRPTPEGFIGIWYNDAFTKRTRTPAVLFHGAGPGVWFYALFLRPLNDLPIVLLELPNMCYCHIQPHMPSVQHTLQALGAFLRSWEITSCHYIGHSMGSMLAAAVVNGTAYQQLPKCDKLVYLEPVCFIGGIETSMRFPFWTVEEARGMIDSSRLLPRGLPSAVKQLFAMVFQHFECRDVFLQEALTRMFASPSQCLHWDQDVEALALFGKIDFVVPSIMVMEHIKAHFPKIKCDIHPTGEHGGFLVDCEYMKFVHSHLRNYLYPK